MARIDIPKQDFNSEVQTLFCENLYFTPWHVTPDLEPVGGLNWLRKSVYTEVSGFRHAKNNAPRHEPMGWCLALDGKACPD